MSEDVVPPATATGIAGAAEQLLENLHDSLPERVEDEAGAAEMLRVLDEHAGALRRAFEAAPRGTTRDEVARMQDEGYRLLQSGLIVRPAAPGVPFSDRAASFDAAKVRSGDSLLDDEREWFHLRRREADA